ncbi:hypothetical protein DB32_001568 [Sandaracinus amylolyticus]|uniref:Uncharacterized protein n=1 Tax=Sandaracinus amylolyticus TaxID=927083 RepID=A0A0F6SE18_9BACT|nr:hypothetical protein DB32_001568 [Sandaracinus amylolyticus]
MRVVCVHGLRRAFGMRRSAGAPQRPNVGSGLVSRRAERHEAGRFAQGVASR